MREGRDRDSGGRDDADGRRRGPERIGDLLPSAARSLGLEDELALASAMAAWESVVRSRAPGAAGACRLVSIDRGIAVVEATEPIVAQEIRIRSMELLGALRSTLDGSVGPQGIRPVHELRVVLRHV